MDLFSSPGVNIVLSIWAVGLVLVIILSYLFHTSEVNKDETGWLQLYRKSFHFIAIFMFLPAGLYNLPLLQLGLVVTACIFVILEAMRFSLKETPIGSFLNDFVSRFTTEEEEEAAVILPHLYLLTGCAIPILISSSPNSIHAYAGIFALCVADAIVQYWFTTYGSTYRLLYRVGSWVNINGQAQRRPSKGRWSPWLVSIYSWPSSLK